MTSDELRGALEPHIIACVNAGLKPGLDVLIIAKRWLDESGLPVEDAMNEYNLVVADIIEAHNLRRH